MDDRKSPDVIRTESRGWKMFPKILGLTLAAATALSLAGCGQNQEGSSVPSEPSESSAAQAPESSGDGAENSAGTEGTGENPETEGSGTLVVYFSWSGNTEEMASYIAEQTGGELLEIQPETPYPTISCG